MAKFHAESIALCCCPVLVNSVLHDCVELVKTSTESVPMSRGLHSSTSQLNMSRFFTP